MNNSILTSKNAFSEGLIMDFSPDNTSANCMTSALNATLLTFNGNEMQLQNDMGNGRVETARLPDGYIPVGSCEFGDIIYIVSYNPLINKSQIGCFPSPERNISSEEIGDLKLSLSAEDFQYLDSLGNPTGKLKASSVKKIIYDSKDMTSGDKYIIYSKELDSDNTKYLSDYDNISHTHGTFPKLVKIHVVSIEESGKMVYLDSTTKWYNNEYYINADVKEDGGSNNLDLDSYRSLVSSAYSIFSSKVSGKLALLVELEKINGFSCSWEPYIVETELKDTETETEIEGVETETETESDIEYVKYRLFWNFNWITNNNDINPNGVILLESDWTGPTYNYAGKALLYGKDQNIEPLVPPKIPDKYKFIKLKRTYTPENFEYDSEKYTSIFLLFIDTVSYNAAIKNLENAIEGSIAPFKVNIAKTETFLPKEGSYYVNCFGKDGTGYYTYLKGQKEYINPVDIKDDIINNYFKYPVIKSFDDFIIPIKKNNFDLNISNLVYHYKIAPTMPYGYLEEFALEGYIDFSKIGKKDIKLNTWKYYNLGNNSTLTWGMDAYTEPGKGISEVIFEFYDDLGFVGAYHNKGKRSYNGKFTEHIMLNGVGSNSKLDSLDSNGTNIYRKGDIISKDLLDANTKYIKVSEGSEELILGKDATEEGTYYVNNTGIILSNYLYLIKIVIKYCNIGVLGEYVESDRESIVEYRWYWTNNMFNNYYYNTSDFNNLKPNLSLDCLANVWASDNFEVDHYLYTPNVGNNKLNPNQIYKSLSANILAINMKTDSNGNKLNDNNVKLSIIPGLLNDFNTFNLNESKKEEFEVYIYLGNEYTTNSPEQPELLYTEEPVSINNNLLLPINNSDLKETRLNQPKINITKVNQFLSNIEITSSSEDEEIWYIIDYADGNSGITKYEIESITVSQSGTIRALVYSKGKISGITETSFTVVGKINLTISPPSGEISTLTEPITITVDKYKDDTIIYYTVDGSKPDVSSHVYTEGGLTVGGLDNLNGTYIVKAIAVTKLNGVTYTTIPSSASYTLSGSNKVATPLISPDSNSITDKTLISITCATKDAIIRYTIDGSEPNSESTKFDRGIFPNSDSTITIKAKAFKDGLEPSGTTTKEYTITKEAENEVVSISEVDTISEISTISETTISNDKFIQEVIKKNTSETLLTVSQTVHDLLGTGVTNSGYPEIYGDVSNYENYVNHFELTSTEDPVNTNRIDVDYISSDGKKESTENCLGYYKKLSDILYGESEGFNFTLSGIHYSKYAYLLLNNPNNTILRSFVLTPNDLYKYNISTYINSENIITPYFNKMLTSSMADAGGYDAHQYTAIIKFTKLDLDRYLGTPELLNHYDKNANGDISLQEGLSRSYDLVSSLLSFMFPFGYAHPNESYLNFRLAYIGDTHIANNKIYDNDVDWYVSNGYKDLGGTLAAITPKAIEPSDAHLLTSNPDILVESAEVVLGYLTQLFYLTDSSEYPIYYPNNFIYLSPNLYSYKRDVIIYLTIPQLKDSHNDFIKMKGMDYSEYLEKILNLSNIVKEEINMKNVKISIENLIQTVPIEYSIEYINPETFVEHKTIVRSIFNEFPTESTLLFEPNTIYGWNSENKIFNILGGILVLKRIKHFEQVNAELGIISTSYTKDLGPFFSLGKINSERRLNIDGDNKLALLDIPTPSQTTYKVKTEPSYGLTGFKKFKLYENINN